MGSIFTGLYSALYAMQRESNKMQFHARNIAHVSCCLDGSHSVAKKSSNGDGVTEANRIMASSLGRLENHKIAPLQENGVLNLNSECGIELAAEMVHIVNVQHNFDANTKSVSTIDTMCETLLNMRV